MAIHCSAMDQGMHRDNLCLPASLQMFSLQKAVACCMFAEKEEIEKLIKTHKTMKFVSNFGNSLFKGNIQNDKEITMVLN